jgi:hypothetical protein
VEGGHVEGPLPDDAVYECTLCTDEGNTYCHCPGGTCPDPCSEYHTVANDHPTTGGDVMYSRIKRTNSGDGFSQGETGEGAHYGFHESYFDEIRDDSIECDWGCNVSIEDSLLEDVNALVAMDPRTGDPRDVTGYTVSVVDSLVKLKAFATTHKVNVRGTGALGLFKYEEDNCPGEHVVTGSTFAFPKLQEDDGLLFPPVQSGNTSSGNTLLWYGSTAELTALLDDTGSASTRCDGLTNRQRLNHYCNSSTSTAGWCSPSCISGMPGCGTWAVVVKTGSGAFLANNWTPVRDAWISSHDADDQP